MSTETKRAKMWRQIIVGVAVALLAGGSSPWWWKALFPPPPRMGHSQGPQEIVVPRTPESGREQPQIPRVLQVRCFANPHLIRPGELTDITVQVISSGNEPISSANILLSSGGGMFSGSGTQTAVGVSDRNGSFTIGWRAPQPAAASYGITATASKPGFDEGSGTCQVLMR